MAVATPTLTSNGRREAKPRLKRSMGLWMATALVIGNMVGSGIFTLPAVLAGEAGPASIVALAFTGLGAMLLALVFANLGRAHPRTGGPYYFARRAFGDFVGFQTAWAYWIAAWVGNAAIAVAFAGYLGVFSNDVRTTNWLQAVIAVGAIWLFTLVNIAGARETGVAQVLTTVLKFVPLALIGIVGLFYIDGGNFTPFTTTQGGFDWHINGAATLALWAFIGLESATVPAEEVKDAEKTIPRATILGTLATTILYLVALVAIVGVMSQAALTSSSAPFADAANTIWGGTFLGLSWGKWIALVAMAATLGALNGWIMLTARVSLAAADDGLFPKWFARVHGKRATPVYGLLASSVLVSGLVLYGWNQSFTDRFTDVVLLATWMTLIAYAYAAAAEVVLFFRERELFSWAKLGRDTVVAGLAFAYSVWAIWGSGEEWLAKGFMLLLFGIPVFVWMKWRESKRTSAQPALDADWLLLNRTEALPPRRATVTTKHSNEKTPAGLRSD
jgi:APA family basic amino acid/polyamine antiporter